MPVDFEPIAEDSVAVAPRRKIDFQPLGGEARRSKVSFEPIVDTPRSKSKVSFEPLTDSQGGTLADFMRAPDAGVSQPSSLTPGFIPSVNQDSITPVPQTDEAVALAQLPANDVPSPIGEEHPVELPRVGQPGTIARGVSDTTEGLVEWALNKPEEALATLSPLAPVIAAKYAPEVAMQFGRDIKDWWTNGDREALGRALTIGALVGGPAAFKKASERSLVEGKPGAKMVSPQDKALEATLPGAEGDALRQGMTVEKRALEVPVKTEEILPSATETLKEIAKQEPLIEKGVTDASKVEEAAALHGNVLRTAQEGKSPEAVPVDEGQPGVRSEETVAAPNLPEPPTAGSEVKEPAGIGERFGAPVDPVPQTLGIKDASVDAQRAQRGLGPLEGPARRDWGETVWNEAKAELAKNPNRPEQIATEILERPRSLSDTEGAVLMHGMMDLRNRLDTAMFEGMEAKDSGGLEASAKVAAAESIAGDLSNRLAALEQASELAGAHQSRGFNFRKAMIREDFSFAGMEMRKRAARNFEPITATEREALARESAKVKDLEKALEKREAEVAKERVARELAELKAMEAKTQAELPRHVKSIVGRVGETLDKWADESRAAMRGKLLSLSPEDLYHLGRIGASNLFHVAMDVGQWTAKMVADFGEGVRPHLAELLKESQRLLDETIGGASTPSGDKRKSAAPKPKDAEAAKKAIKNRLEGRIKSYEDKISKGDYSTKKRTPPPVDKEILAIQHRLDTIKKQFFEGLVEDKMRRRTRTQKVFGGAVESLNTMRAVLTSADLSAVLRQGKFVALAHPIRAARSIVPMLKAFASEREAFRVEKEIQSRENYPLYKASKLYLAEHGASLSKMEEAYMSRWASKIPGVKHIVKSSERAYITFLNKLRADSFDAMKKTLGKGGEVSLPEARILSNFINVATGRGTIGMADQAAAGLNAVFFAPRFVASRFQMLLGQPIYYGVLSGKAGWKGTARARLLVASEYARILAGAAVVYAIGKSAGADIETDPRSTDFGKMKFGNTRIDPMAGVNQVTVLLSKIASGKKKTLGGKVIPLEGEKMVGEIARFARMKLAPAPAMAVDLVAKKDVVGNKVTPASALMKATVPISMKDVYEAMIEQGVPRGTAIGLLSIFGEGVQTFDAHKNRTQ